MISFYLYDGVNETVVNPLNRDILVSLKPDASDIFSRYELETVLIFVKEDRNFIIDTWGDKFCEQITLRVYDDCTGSNELIYEGYATLYDFVFDNDKCQIEAKFSPNDDYRCIIENQEKQVNILKKCPVTPVIAETFRPQIERIWSGGRTSVEDEFYNENKDWRLNGGVGGALGNYAKFSELGLNWGNDSECEAIGCDGLKCIIGFSVDTNGEPSDVGWNAFYPLGPGCDPDNPDVMCPRIIINDTWRHWKTRYMYDNSIVLSNYVIVKSWYYREVAFTKDLFEIDTGGFGGCSDSEENKAGTLVSPPGDGWVPMDWVCTGDKSIDIKNDLGLSIFVDIQGVLFKRIPDEFVALYKTKAGYRKWVRPYLYGQDLTFTRTGCENPTFDSSSSFPPAPTVNYNNGRNIIDVLNYIVSETCAKQIESEILLNDINPVTGENPNPLKSLVVFQKSDVKNPLARTNANKAMTSFKEFTGFLREMFQIYWFINDSGNIQFEHVSYFYGWVAGYGFSSPQVLDFTEGDLKKFDRNRYWYSRDEMPDREKFSMMESGNQDFIGVDITYNQLCSGARITGNTINHELPRVTTDLWYIQNNPTSISDDGFVFLISSGVKEGQDHWVQGVLSGDYIANAYLSWANLHERYWQYNRPLPNGNMNGIERFWKTNKGIIIGEQLQFIICCQFLKMFDLVKTSIGVGYIDSFSIDLVSKKCSLNLRYGYSV